MPLARSAFATWPAAAARQCAPSSAIYSISRLWTLQLDGALILEVTVGSELELRPWILSWGSHVEILAPTAFRDLMKAEIEAMGQVYQSGNLEIHSGGPGQ